MDNASTRDDNLDHETELECRVCRGGPETDRPLFSPCLCSGSIAVVHQDCLEEWLQHSRKESCELCNTHYIFIPLYAENTPDVVPLNRLILTTVRKCLFEWLPFSIRIMMAILLWLLVVPVSTSWLYRFWIHGNRVITFTMSVPFMALSRDVMSGIVLAGVIGVSFIVLLSFADFLRFHWNFEPQAVDMNDEDDLGAGNEPNDFVGRDFHPLPRVLGGQQRVEEGHLRRLDDRLPVLPPRRNDEGIRPRRDNVAGNPFGRPRRLFGGRRRVVVPPPPPRREVALPRQEEGLHPQDIRREEANLQQTRREQMLAGRNELLATNEAMLRQISGGISVEGTEGTLKSADMDDESILIEKNNSIRNPKKLHELQHDHTQTSHRKDFESISGGDDGGNLSSDAIVKQNESDGWTDRNTDSSSIPPSCAMKQDDLLRLRHDEVLQAPLEEPIPIPQPQPQPQPEGMGLIRETLLGSIYHTLDDHLPMEGQDFDIRLMAMSAIWFLMTPMLLMMLAMAASGPDGKSNNIFKSFTIPSYIILLFCMFTFNTIFEIFLDIVFDNGRRLARLQLAGFLNTGLHEHVYFSSLIIYKIWLRLSNDWSGPASILDLRHYSNAILVAMLGFFLLVLQLTMVWLFKLLQRKLLDTLAPPVVQENAAPVARDQPHREEPGLANAQNVDSTYPPKTSSRLHTHLTSDSPSSQESSFKTRGLDELDTENMSSEETKFEGTASQKELEDCSGRECFKQMMSEAFTSETGIKIPPNDVHYMSTFIDSKVMKSIEKCPDTKSGGTKASEAVEVSRREEPVLLLDVPEGQETSCDSDFGSCCQSPDMRYKGWREVNVDMPDEDGEMAPTLLHIPAVHPPNANPEPVVAGAHPAAGHGVLGVVDRNNQAGEDVDQGLLGPEAEEEEEDNADGLGGEEIEIHLAIDELLGLRGPAHVLWRNILWLLAFNGTYIGLFAFFPYSIGSTVLAAFSGEPSPSMKTLLSNIPETFKEFFLILSDLSGKSPSILQISDIGVIALGYTTVAAIIFVLGTVVGEVHSRLRLASVALIRDILETLVSVVKVGVLLFLRIFLLPMILGCLLLRCANEIFELSSHTWANYTASNPVGVLALVWVLGISYMLIVTLSVLQLREVLHPDILAKVIRPQEAHLDLLSSLLHETCLTHLRRIAASMCVYVFLIAVIVWPPTVIVRWLLGAPWVFRLWSWMPLVRVPVELTGLHLVFLAILEKHKDLIGKTQFTWMCFACEKLGVSRFLLPFATLSTPTQANDTPVIAHRPMRRPLHGWALQQSNNARRWAWGTEPVSEVQQAVAPRVQPTYWILRIIALLTVTWALLLFSGCTLLLLPIALGRLVWIICRLPTSTIHDPMCITIGLYIVMTTVGIFPRSLNVLVQRVHRVHITVPANVRIEALHLAVVMFGVLPLVLGFVVRTALLQHPMSGFYAAFLPSYTLMLDWLFGYTLVVAGRKLKFFCGRLVSLVHGGRQNIPLSPPTLGESELALKACMECVEYMDQRRWQSALELMSSVWTEIVNPKLASIISMIFMTLFGTVASFVVFFGVISQQTNKISPAMDLNVTMGVGLRLSLWLYLARLAALALRGPFSQLTKYIHDAVRDEHYLIGRKLKNCREH